MFGPDPKTDFLLTQSYSLPPSSTLSLPPSLYWNVSKLCLPSYQLPLPGKPAHNCHYQEKLSGGQVAWKILCQLSPLRATALLEGVI